jgi:FHS family Na+ dependent glucose MFS transporter 1
LVKETVSTNSHLPNSVSLIPQSLIILANLWAATLAVGFFMAPIWATGFNLAKQSIKLTATISNIIFLGDSFGAVVLPWVTGQAVEHLGAQTMP